MVPPSSEQAAAKSGNAANATRRNRGVRCRKSMRRASHGDGRKARPAKMVSAPTPTPAAIHSRRAHGSEVEGAPGVRSLPLASDSGACHSPKATGAEKKITQRRKGAKNFGDRVCLDLCAFAPLRDLFLCRPPRLQTDKV